jgi:hypothetical protein
MNNAEPRWKLKANPYIGTGTALQATPNSPTSRNGCPSSLIAAKQAW